MNIELETDAKHAEIAARLAKAEAAKEKAAKAGCRHTEKTVRKWLKNLGLAGGFRIHSVNAETGATLSTGPDADGRYGYIDINWEPGIIEAAGGARSRTLEIEVRQLKASEERPQDAALARAAGRLAESLGGIKRDLAAHDWSAYDGARRSAMDIRAELERYDRGFVKARLAPGAKIGFGIYGSAEVERLTKKRIIFAGGGYEDIDETLEKLADGRWKYL
ncbi:MAG: hypothetical protein K6F50_07500 [Kiritimatiellae bacterium]|nr:hypothetical protein [Kiritimatiellia bacterium]